MPNDLADIDNPGFFTWPGCTSPFGSFPAIPGIGLTVLYAFQEYAKQLPRAGRPEAYPQT